MKLSKQNTKRFSDWKDRSDTLKLHPNQQIYKVMLNDYYSVQFSKFISGDGEMIHLWIRNNQGLNLGWSEKQAIKNAVVGPDRWAMEMFPAEKDNIKQGPMYHLYVFPEGFRPTFGLHTEKSSA